jgi:hypothetical protein
MMAPPLKAADFPDITSMPDPNETKPKPVRVNAPRGTRKDEIPAYQEGYVTESVADFYRLAAMAMMPFAPTASAIILEPDDPNDDKSDDWADHTAELWDKACATHPKLRRTLYRLVDRGDLIPLAAAHAPIAAALVSTLPIGKLWERVARRFGQE